LSPKEPASAATYGKVRTLPAALGKSFREVTPEGGKFLLPDHLEGIGSTISLMVKGIPDYGTTYDISLRIYAKSVPPASAKEGRVANHGFKGTEIAEYLSGLNGKAACSRLQDESEGIFDQFGGVSNRLAMQG
jgi:hypothetical protein